MNDAMPRPTREALLGTARLIASQADELIDVLDGMAALRRLGPGGCAVADAAMELRPVKLLRVSWELFELLSEDQGEDSFDLLDQIDEVAAAFKIMDAFENPDEDELECDCDECTGHEAVLLPFAPR